jgi:predicted nucleic acid-binding protein
VFDASVFIPYLTAAGYREIVADAINRDRAYLPAPVVEELYAGRRSQTDKRNVDRFYRELRSRNQILVPTDEDWANAGLLMARHNRRFGQINPKDHLNDVLIAILASNHGGTLITENGRNYSAVFRRLSRRAMRPAL